jgi:hypothetical protein
MWATYTSLVAEGIKTRKMTHNGYDLIYSFLGVITTTKFHLFVTDD